MKESERLIIFELGKRISHLRREKGLTQAQLSDLAEMEESALRRVELGGTNPTLKTLLRIAKGLETPIKDLLDFSIS